MFKTIRTLALVCAVGLSPMAMAWPQTVTPRMPCPMTLSSCPITVKKALSKVDGVQQVKTGEKREAVVTFDDRKPRSKSSVWRAPMPVIRLR